MKQKDKLAKKTKNLNKFFTSIMLLVIIISITMVTISLLELFWLDKTLVSFRMKFGILFLVLGILISGTYAEKVRKNITREMEEWDKDD